MTKDLKLKVGEVREISINGHKRKTLVFAGETDGRLEFVILETPTHTNETYLLGHRWRKESLQEMENGVINVEGGFPDVVKYSPLLDQEAYEKRLNLIQNKGS